MNPDLSHIDGILWDLDGTLYRYDHIFIEACNHAAAHTALHLGLPLSFDDALAMARQSFEDWGSSSHYYCKDHGIDYRDFHEPYHERIDTAIIARNAEMIAALESLHMPMAILTNASRVWVKRILSHTGMDHLFTDATIIALEDVGFQAKAATREGFEIGMRAIHRNAAQTLMVEDLPRNLIFAKEMGMTTALVHHGKVPDAHLPLVDHQFQTTLDLVRAIPQPSGLVPQP